VNLVHDQRARLNVIRPRSTTLDHHGSDNASYFILRYHALMFIAIVGSRFSGKSTVEDYLIAKGFTSVKLPNKDVEAGPAELFAPDFWEVNNKFPSDYGRHQISGHAGASGTNQEYQ
jgi:hypothetical protein